MSTSLIVARRFCGPTESANGGYVCGLIAARSGNRRGVTVRLLKPPPLETELHVVERDDAREIGPGQRAWPIEVVHGGEVVARARPGDLTGLRAPAAPDRALAAEASRRYAGFRRHPAPACFVCGPERAPGSGLRIFAGALRAEAGPAHLVAAPWTPDASLDAGDGLVAAEYLWAALDCPGYAAVAEDMRPMLLGELTVEVERSVPVGEPCIVVGWPIAAQGRKHEAGTALFDARGNPCARARATWIEPRPMNGPS